VTALLLRGGHVVDGAAALDGGRVIDGASVVDGGQVVGGARPGPRRADVLVSAGRIEAILDPGGRPPAGAEVVDCAGRLVMPGFVDTHSHADAAVFEPDVQRALLRQGVTTIIAGQDGVSYAPGDGRYASGYFAALNGAHPAYRGGGVAGLLAGYDGRIPLNVGYLVPHGTVRHEVMGSADRAATVAELDAMRRLVAAGLSEGAVGLSSGLDYVPGLFADAGELALLCRPVAEAGGVYVTHMRGGYETNAKAGVDEVRLICRDSGVRAHISHLHGPAPLLLGLVAGARSEGIDLTFDAYPYRAGCTLLSMPRCPRGCWRWARGGRRTCCATRPPATTSGRPGCPRSPPPRTSGWAGRDGRPSLTLRRRSTAGRPG
jgi:N-acyl-D-amino-acid deacylase